MPDSHDDAVAPAASASATAASHDLPSMARAVADAIRENRIDEAESLLNQLCAVYPAPGDFTVFGVVIAIQRGRPREALWALEALPGDAYPELKALCLHVLDEPTWEGRAREIEDSDSADPVVRRAMRQLLDRPVEDDHAVV